MKTVLKYKKFPKTDKEIYKMLMEIKSIIDTISEQKQLHQDHELVLASDNLNFVLDNLEHQIKLFR